ncbi:cupin domain-containing protein [Acidicapsa ligni]|uniref:hypothetical protein n=1 Tax=Acidicapsa ligni TaxID=542300 RepID=UPI0021DF65A8|nr:hypothetical protein [Acidicapsa ligni]
MSRFLRRFIPNLNEHLTDDRLASLFCDELPFAERLVARQHLAKCWHCRVRQEDLEGRRADRMVDLYRDALSSEDLMLQAKPRDEFARRLELRIQRETPRRRWAFRFPHVSFPVLTPMNPTVAVGMVLGLMAVISFFTWWQQRAPDITSNTLLVRAEKWDISSSAHAVGVVYQTVQITTRKQTMKRSIYRDLQGKRQPRLAKLEEKEEHLRGMMVRAGLDWDEPLSASGYQTWHDHQHIREDHIVRTGRHLLRLTTAVPDGSVSEQSLTVRDTDFHPVQRTVAFRDNDTVEIAELDFKILPWTAIDASVFEPIGGVLRAEPASPARVLSFPRMPEVINTDQLDETELGARLILNQLHADTGEQIEINRISQGIEVEGMVETDERKRELQAHLQTLPHVVVSIRSVDELKNNPDAGENVRSIKTASMPDQPSPLEIYLQTRGRGVSAISVLAQKLFNCALTISQESKAIVELRAHFLPDEQKTVIASAMSAELIYSHHERLRIALKEEHELLAEVPIGPLSVDKTSTSRPASGAATVAITGAPVLMDAAARNLALCRELTQTNSPAARSAENILAEMSATMGDLTAGANEAYGKPQDDTVLSGKK